MCPRLLRLERLRGDTNSIFVSTLSRSQFSPKKVSLYVKHFYLVFLFQTLVALVQPIEDLLKHLLLLVDFAEGFVDFRLEFTDRRHFFKTLLY